ncbi:MAG: hypothetical protein ACM3N9_07825 [Syntrophothermus sp.]
MKKVFIFLLAVITVSISGCKKEEKTASFVDQQTVIKQLFDVGMQWRTQQMLKSTVPINISVDNTIGGPAGGNIHVLGSVTGSMNIDDNTGQILGGSMFLEATETINDYAVMYDGEKFTMTGDPYISLVGTFTLGPGGNTFGTASDLVIAGGVTISGAGQTKTINMQITININSAGTGGTVSGSYDGKSIYYSF